MKSQGKILLVILSLMCMVTLQDVEAQSRFWGAQASGMAGAYTAAPGGFSGISYNPSSSSSVTDFEFSSDFTQFSQNSLDVNNGALGLGFGIGTVTQGIAINRTAIDFDFNNFSVTSRGLSLDYDDDIYYYNASVQPVASARFGANAKYFSVTSDVQGADADGYGLDLGYQQKITKRFTLGLSLINLGAERDWDSGFSEDIPRSVRLGLRVRPISSLSIETDIVHDEDAGLERYLLGGEWWLVRRIPSEDNQMMGVAIRSGLDISRVGDEPINFSAGMSFKLGIGEFHYAFQERDNFDNQQQFGLTVEFGRPSY